MVPFTSNSHHMFIANLTVLSYHRFTEAENKYAFSRTYKQFANDLATKDFDWITIDDGHGSIMKACEMMREKNFRAKIFISTALIDTPGHLTRDQVWLLSRHHDIGNHSHDHIKLTELNWDEMMAQVQTASKKIKEMTGVMPRYFVPPWNQYNELLLEVVNDNNMQLVRDRVDIKNDSR